eukprot:gb/GECH01001701.1/.p1 GENE.gb/GECH01001701.1/~~gb/GECH01001701.1/.p1  ORF type:complete len:263 (+),score=89.35 gb/GECH01001701.1/:1-789(+)
MNHNSDNQNKENLNNNENQRKETNQLSMNNNETDGENNKEKHEKHEETEEEKKELKQLLIEFLNQDSLQIMENMGFIRPVAERALLFANNDVNLALDYIKTYENFQQPITLAEAAEIIANRENPSEDITSDEEYSSDDDSDSFLDYKMVIIIREDLGMSVGKIAAQCAHAAVQSYQKASSAAKYQYSLIQWQNTGSKKIVVKASSELEIKRLQEKANSLDILHAIIYDAGRTQVAPHTLTCMAVGPAHAADVDQVTGKLRLL